MAKDYTAARHGRQVCGCDGVKSAGMPAACAESWRPSLKSGEAGPDKPGFRQTGFVRPPLRRHRQQLTRVAQHSRNGAGEPPAWQVVLHRSRNAGARPIKSPATTQDDTGFRAVRSWTPCPCPMAWRQGRQAQPTHCDSSSPATATTPAVETNLAADRAAGRNNHPSHRRGYTG